MEITGILMRKLGERSGVSQRNGQPWKTAEFLVEIPGQYPHHVNFSVRDGQVGRIARFESMVGKTVTVSFDIDAHEYEGRWYNELGAWGVMEYVAGRQIPQTTVAPEPQQDGGSGAAPSAPSPTTGEAPQAAPEPQPQNQEGGGDDLAF